MTARAAATAPAELPLWRKLLSFLIAAALIAYVLSRLDFAAFLRALGSTHYFEFAGFIVVFQLALLSADSLATSHVYRSVVCPVRFRDVMLIRGASYLPSMLNHHVGQAWLTYFVSKAYRAPLWRVAGATLLVYATTFGGVFLLGVAALPLSRGHVPWLATVLGALAVGGVFYMVLVYLKPAFLRRRQATAPLMELGVRGHLRELAYRMPHVAVLFVGNWVPFLFFGVALPLSQALVYVPALMLVAALPITPQGVGTRDVLALELLSHFTPAGDHHGAAIVAATLSYACGMTIVQALFSPLLMRRVQRLLSAPAAAAAPSGEQTCA